MISRFPLILFIAAAAVNAQPFLNLDFEVVTRGRLRGWSTVSAPYVGAQDLTVFKTGKASYRIRNAGAVTTTGFSQRSIPAEPFIGKRLRLSGSVRTEAVANAAAFYLRADPTSGSSLGFATLQSQPDAPRGTNDWKEYAVELTIPERTLNVTIGVLLSGTGTVWYDGLKLEADGVEVPQGPEPFIGEPSPVQLDWLRKNSIRLESNATGSGFDDLAGIKQIVGDARIVGIGENSYGVSEFKRLKTRLIEYLTSEMGFNIVAVEANMPEAYKLNEYVLDGVGDPKALLKDLYYWFYGADEALELVEWMREFNASGKGRVQFTGFDMQYPQRAGDIVRRFVEENDPGYLSTLDPIYAEMKALDEIDVTNANVARFRKSLEDTAKVREYLEGKFPDAVWPVQNARIVEQAQANRIAPDDYHREEMMAKNAAWILEQNPDSKMVIWALNLHVSRLPRWQGDWLNRRFGKDYLAMGFAFDRGAYAAINPQYRILPRNTASTSFAGTVENVFKQVGTPRFLIDLRAATPGSDGEWLLGEMEFRDIGQFVIDGFSLRQPIGQEYDVLVWMDEVTPVSFPAAPPGALTGAIRTRSRIR